MQRIIVIGLLLFAATASAAEKKCELQRFAELPVTMSGTRPLIAGTINGHPAKFLADSGAFFSMLTRDAVAKFGLRVGAMPANIRVRGTGGAADVGLTKVSAFTLNGFLGGRVQDNVEFIVGGNLFDDGVAGIIGQNVLGNADTEYDLANGIIRVFKTDNCKDAMLAYWARNMAVATLELEDRTPLRPHLRARAKLNGKSIRILLDTGAWRSLLTLDAAARAGIEPEDDGVEAAGISRGLGKRTTENSLARFDTLDVGGEVIRNARLRIGDAELVRSDMLLGADFFLSHRIYVASRQDKIYFTYNGGPVFDLRATPKEAQTPAPTTTLAADGPADDGLDAHALRRRGTASAGRGDFDAAIADFDRAIALDATEPDNFYERALAKLQKRQPLAAIVDLDTALKLRPDHVQALIARGTVRLRGGNQAGASSDFQEALRVAPRDAGTAFRIAEAYQSAGQFAAAIERMDAWVTQFPKDDRLPTVLTARCWSRAMTGKDLNLARADCDSALKKGAKNSIAYDSRGLVWLLLGNYPEAIDDYKEALELQPKKASSLYGLGLAEIKAGAKDSGEKNIQAALAIDSGIAASFRRAGLAP